MEEKLSCDEILTISDPVHCIICGDVSLKKEITDEEDCAIEEKENASVIFQSFFKLFEVRLTNAIAWNCEKERIPFCIPCQDQLGQLLQLKKDKEELSKVIYEGKHQLKDKLVNSESSFKSMGIYEKDGRYLKARYLLGKKCAKLKNRFEKISFPEAGHRKSIRNAKLPKLNYEERINKRPTLVDDKEDHELDISEAIVKFEEGMMSYHEAMDDEPGSPPDDSGNISDVSFEGGWKKPKYWHSRKTPTASERDEDWSPIRKPKKLAKKAASASAKSNVSKRKQTIPDIEKEMHAKFDKVAGTCTLRQVTFDKVDDNQYKCRMCFETIPKGRLRYHVISKHTNLTTCKECGKQLCTVKMLQVHMKHVHQGEKYLASKKPCPICSKIVRVNSLRLHKWSHYNEQEKLDAVARGEKDPFLADKICDECGKRFRKDYEVTLHKSKVHPQPGEAREKKVCPECGKMVFELDSHILYHREKEAPRPRTFICLMCSKGFLNMKDLRKHRKRHERQYKCTLCVRSFNKEENLQSHMKQHLRVKPYQCSKCKKKFASEKFFQNHEINCQGGQRSI